MYRINQFPKFNLLQLSAFIALALTLAACASIQVGQKFDIQAFQEMVKPGETTQSDVRNILGAPSSQGIVVEQDGTQYTRWVYYHATGKLHKPGDTKLKLLEIQFSQNKMVSSYNWSE